MILLLAVVVLIAGFYWSSTVFRRRVDRHPSSDRGRRGHPSTGISASAPGTTSMVWTAVDERQFRRLTDGTSSDDGK